MVDEYQDTIPKMDVLDETSMATIASWWGIKQSIYRFRQADPIDFHDKFMPTKKKGQRAVDPPLKRYEKRSPPCCA